MIRFAGTHSHLRRDLASETAGAASRLSPGVYVRSCVGSMTFDPHLPVLGWQLSPLMHVDIGSPSAPVTPTFPLHTLASTK